MRSYREEEWAGLLKGARWFMGKGRVLARARPLGGWDINGDGRLELVEARYAQGAPELYAVAIERDSPVLKDCWEKAAKTLLQLAVEGGSLRSSLGRLCGKPYAYTEAKTWGEPAPESLEQSNSAALFPGHGFVKLYRKLEAGPHPEAEMGLALRRAGFNRVPRVLASLCVNGPKAPLHLGIVQEWVPHHGEAWTGLGARPDEGRAGLLGRRIAEMHRALSTRGLGRDFGLSRCESDLHARRALEGQAAKIEAQLRVAAGGKDEAARWARELLKAWPEISAFKSLGREWRLRVHGDLHLGQVLCAADDFVIVDFEGEPARPLSQRRERQNPLRDVAGMLRSFAYAEAVFADAYKDGKPGALGDAFWQAYRKELGGAPWLEGNEQKALRAYVRAKALYEVGYELSSRPSWLPIPARGLLESL